MELNININLGLSSELRHILMEYISDYEKDIELKEAIAKETKGIHDQIEARESSMREMLSSLFKHAHALNTAADEEEPTPATDSPSAPEEAAAPEESTSAPEAAAPASTTTPVEAAVPEASPEGAPALDPKKRATRRKKSTTAPESPAPESAPAPTPSPSPVEAAVPEGFPEGITPEEPTSPESPWSLPFSPEYSAAGSTPDRPEMTLDTARQVLADTRQHLQLEEGQEHFDKKRAFNTEVKSLLAYYGGDRLSALTSANLYWAAAQIANITITDDGRFDIPDPFITPEQVEEFKNAPFKQ